LWQSLAAILDRLPEATILVPHEVVLERDPVLRALQPKNLRRVFVSPDMVKSPMQPGPPATNGAPLVHLATVNPWKGHTHLLQAMRIVATEGLQGHVHSYGPVADTSLLKALKAGIDLHALSDRLLLLDYVADSETLIKSSSGVVVTSVSHSGGPETFGRTVIEAWAQARPVIAFAAGAPARMIRHQVDGLLVREGDEHALAAAIHSIQSDPALGRRLGEAGFEHVRKTFDARPVVDRLFAILCGGGRQEAQSFSWSTSRSGRPQH
jgi:glycosyltransferase involved in cell wall biosynthesis